MNPAPQPQDNRELIIAIIRRFSELPELKELPNAERNYLAGDIYNLLQKHDAATAAQAREKELCELLYYINPDSRAGVVIIERLKSLRTKEQP